MSDLSSLNLDYLAAKHAQELVQGTKKANDLENSLTKTLGVLQENGVYACFLYLVAREKENGEIIVDHLLNLLGENAFGFPKLPQKKEGDDILRYIAENITADLHHLLLAKEALEQMLIYARYGAKALQKE